jgi:thiol-disulfide isomerase/thioredoxin
MACSVKNTDIKTVDTTFVKCEINGVGKTNVHIRKYDFLFPDFQIPVNVDTLFTKDDHFEFDIAVQGGLCIDLYFDSFKKQSRLIFLESNEKVTITGNMNKTFIDQFGREVFDLEVKGAKSHDELIKKELELANSSDVMAHIEKIIKTSPDSYLTPVFILISPPYVHYYDSLSFEVKKSYYGQILSKIVDHKNKTKEGSAAIDFSCIDINGKKLSLFEVKSKYKVIDFWASWCKPCRLSHPGMRKLYDNYNREELEIISISSDGGNVDAWKKAITQDSIGMWRHIIENKCGYNISTEYSVASLPTKLVIDKNNRIVKRYEGESAEFISFVHALLK